MLRLSNNKNLIKIGLPGHANYHYLTEILKQELGFEGTFSRFEN